MRRNQHLNQKPANEQNQQPVQQENQQPAQQENAQPEKQESAQPAKQRKEVEIERKEIWDFEEKGMFAGKLTGTEKVKFDREKPAQDCYVGKDVEGVEWLMPRNANLEQKLAKIALQNKLPIAIEVELTNETYETANGTGKVFKVFLV